MPGKPKTVKQYFAALPEDRREALQAVRQVINDNLDDDIEEGMQYGMPSWYVPHDVYPPGYHCDRTQPLPYAGLAAQKHHMAMYFFCVYTSEDEQRWLREQWAKSGKKLDMGKSCIRFKSLDDVPLDVIARTIRRNPAKKHIARYEAAFGDSGGPARKKAATSRKTATTKKTTTKKTTKKKTNKTTAKKRPATKAGTKTARTTKKTTRHGR